MDEVKHFFEQLKKENNGQLDILVNMHFKIIIENFGKTFYKTDPEVWDIINNFGLQNHYFCSVYASRIMAKNNKGLIVNVSSADIVAYAVGKQAMDRLSSDMAHELAVCLKTYFKSFLHSADSVKKRMCFFSIWPGPVRTEHVQKMIEDDVLSSTLIQKAETVEYPGKAVVELAKDPKRMNKTGQILLTADLGREYGFVDVDVLGTTPANLRSLSSYLNHVGWPKLASWIPNWIRLPGWLIWAANSRFHF